VKIFNHKWLLIIFLTALFAQSTVGYSATRKNSFYVVIDAGGSSTQAILYRKDKLGVSKIRVMDSNQTLASFKDGPEKSGEDLISPLLDNIIPPVPRATIKVSVLGTEGMRILTPEQQKSIYAVVSKTIRSKGFKLGRVSTVESWEEGIFTWAHLNKLSGLSGSDKTNGIIEVGTTSSQVTFDTKTEKITGTHRVELNNRIYHILSESLLGYGVDSIRYALSKTGWQYRCYPDGYKNYPGFDFFGCEEAFSRLLAIDKSGTITINKILNVKSFSTTHFAGVDEVYSTLSFFDSQNPSINALSDKMNGICYSMNAVQNELEEKPLSEQYEPENKCINGVYLYNLLFKKLKIKDGQLYVIKDVNETDVSWTAGFLLLSE
jgi:hypothetical protein